MTEAEKQKLKTFIDGRRSKLFFQHQIKAIMDADPDMGRLLKIFIRRGKIWN